MATTKDYKEFVLEQLSNLQDVTCKPMMGEYLLYLNGVLFGGLYDNRVLIKKTPSLANYGLNTAIPYDGAKGMYEIDIENVEEAKNYILKAYEDLVAKRG